MKEAWNKRHTTEEIERMLQEVKITYDEDGKLKSISPYPFCPRCGCKYSQEEEHDEMEYPDQWTEWFCSKCGYLVAEVDNSPYIHCLQCLDYTIN